MMNKRICHLVVFLCLLGTFSSAQTIDRTCATCSRQVLDSANMHINPVRVNQVGYRTGEKYKKAYIADPQSMNFSILRLSDNSVAYQGALEDMGDWPELDGKLLVKLIGNLIS